MTDRQIWDVAIVGGGVIGLACAFELARRRHRVIVIERDQPGQHASRVAAGLLGTAAFPLGEDDGLFPLKLDSLRRYPEFIAKVEPIGRRSAGYRMDGTLWVARDADEDEQLEALHVQRRQRGLRSVRVGSDEIFPIEPELAEGLVGGLLVDEDVQVDPRRLLETLEQAVKIVRVRLLVGTETVGGEYDDSEHAWSVRLRQTDSGAVIDPVLARNVILTAGPWCDSVIDSATESGSSLAPTGVGPVKGQLLRLRGPRVIDRVVRTANVSLAQRRDGELIVASTKEPEAGWDLTPTDDAREALLERASDLIPRIRELDLEEHSVGLRPAVADHLPVIGSAGRPGLWIATGHFQHGILLAPSTAYWLAEAMESGEAPALLKPYGIERLGEPEVSMEAAS
ncbi:MAG: FAD-dependent oxidoreductase [Chloroflexota bacterium]|nr:FAD-dependent oxidoreductase [Chloroflexota bacterium]